jgi:hypothetical protein
MPNEPTAVNPDEEVGSPGTVAPEASGSQAADTNTAVHQDLAHPQSPDFSGGDHPGCNDPCLDDALVGALSSVSPDVVSMIDHTLDHLTTSADLFDVPPVDFHDTGST